MNTLVNFGYIVILQSISKIYINVFRRWLIMKRTRDGSSVGHYNYLAQALITVFSTSYYAIALTWVLAFPLAFSPLVGWSYYSPELSGMRYKFLAICIRI